ncbi:imelysin family protein [Cohaesibacter intestini]|uniref:imelysin family protein n=1 Tax=Cohaesibacter intestini TaxID=2211145 RepID=UPI000DEA4ABA|nr:imelysin family protein [Cohaesibacter intestini]
MLKYCLALFALLMGASPTFAATPTEEVDLEAIVQAHIIPRYETLLERAEALEQTAKNACGTNQEQVRDAYHTAFDAWIAVSHLRFGPSEQDDRAFALAFWPDSKGFTPKTLHRLLKGDDPALKSLEDFRHVSIAGRGFYALDFLLYDKRFVETPARHYCDLVKLITADITHNVEAILADWQTDYATRITEPGNDIYRDKAEAVQQIYTALKTGLEFTAQTRLGRPMGSFKKPRPRRAEAWRSGRSLRNVQMAIESTRELAMILSDGDADIDGRFANALKLAEDLNDPTFSTVATIQGRIRVEALQVAITQILEYLDVYLAQKLGIGAGFNSLDGD